MGVRGKATRLLDVVELFRAVKKSDGMGGTITDYEKITEAAASVTIIGGSRLLYFQSIGYTKPVEIRLYKQDFDQLRYNGKIVTESSREVDSNNNLMLTIQGDFIDV